jgi:hypothetical protein
MQQLFGDTQAMWQGFGDEQFRVPKSAIRVEVLMDGGRLLPGTFHVTPEASLHAGRERVIDLLDAGDPYLPMTGPAGPRLLAKHRIVAVRVADAVDAGLQDQPDGVVRAKIELTLAHIPEDRARMQGTVSIAMPPGRTRVLDYLNGVGEFLPLETAEGFVLIARRYVLEVRPA